MQNNATAHGKSLCQAFAARQALSPTHRRFAQILPFRKRDNLYEFRAIRKAGESARGPGTMIFRPQAPQDFPSPMKRPRLPKGVSAGSIEIRFFVASGNVFSFRM